MNWKKLAWEQAILLEQQREEIAMLKAKIARLKKNSSTSSKPPSSDIVKPTKDKDRRRKHKIGAQQGHKQNLRQPIAPELVDEIVKLEFTHCPDCGHKLDLDKVEPKTFQQIELVEKPFIVTEFQQHQYWCEKCQCYHDAPLPPEVKRSGLFGKNLIALTGYLKGRCHMSFTTMQDFFADAFGIRVSTGFLTKQIRKASEALKKSYEQLVEQLPKQNVNISIGFGG